MARLTRGLEATATRLISGPVTTFCAMIMTDPNNADPTTNTSVLCWGLNGIVDLAADGQSSVCVKTHSTNDVYCWGAGSQSTTYPVKFIDASSRAVVSIWSPLSGSDNSRFGYIDQFGLVSSGGTDTSPEPNCSLLSEPDGGAF